MSVTAAIRRMLAAGLTIEQALIAAEAMEAELVPQKSAGAVRQQLPARQWDEVRVFVFERDGYRCVYCGDNVSDRPQCDHVIPLIQGGGSDPDNLVTACKRCNSSKAGRRPDEWVPSWQ